MRRALVLLLFAACIPDFGDRESLVTAPRVIAVVADPPDVKPGTTPVSFRALIVSPDGAVTTTPSLAFCTTPKLLTENGPVSAECLGDGATPFAGAAPVPADACAIFGPETPPGGLRPRDPDVTGGFFQPVRVTVPSSGTTAFAFERIVCNLANAPADAANTMAKTYVPNVNPQLLPLDAHADDGTSVPLDAIAHGARVVFRASWPAASAESYPMFDIPSQAVVTRRESLRVSWFATSGAFDNDVTGRTEDDPASFTENGWTAPPDASIVHVWRVLRDARGGAAFDETLLVIR